MLFNRGVNISRAVWYIRTVGGIEVVRPDRHSSPRRANQFHFPGSTLKRIATLSILPATTSNGPILSASLSRTSSLLLHHPRELSIREKAKPRNRALLLDPENYGWPSLPIRKGITLYLDATVVLTRCYCDSQHLISALYTENLLDQALLLKFLITQVQTCSLQQLFFTLILVNDYLDEMVKSEVVASLLVGRCLDRLFQVKTHLSPLPSCLFY